jgi:hypothetical protein
MREENFSARFVLENKKEFRIVKATLKHAAMKNFFTIFEYEKKYFEVIYKTLKLVR